MSHTVTFNIADDKSNVLGYDAVVDEFTTAEFEQGILESIFALENKLTLFHQFNYTGAEQTITLSAGAYLLRCWGASGHQGTGWHGGTVPGKGGYAEGKITLTEETTLYLYIGQVGQYPTGGWNGGGNGVRHTSWGGGGGGGGATDVRQGGNALANRILVAGAGGGDTRNSPSGGDGGGLVGEDGGGANGGTGGTQGAGGSVNGALGQGGIASNRNGGGGGGYYGGGGGSGSNYTSGGGGGSSYIDGVDDGSTKAGVHTGSGLIQILSLEGNRISPPTSLDSYGATGPDLKIKWKVVPDEATLTVETAITDSDSVLPDEGDWAVQTNGSSIDNLPADLTGMYLRTRIKMTATETSPFLEWLVVYDNADNPYAAVRIDFNDEIKAVPATGTVEFENVDPAADIPYTVYVLGLNHDNIVYDTVEGDVTVVDADITENVTFIISAARVTQFYVEVALGEPVTSSPARVTHFYIEMATPTWYYNLVAASLRISPKLSAAGYGLSYAIAPQNMQCSPRMSAAGLTINYSLEPYDMRIIPVMRDIRINTQGLCIFYTLCGRLCFNIELTAEECFDVLVTEDQVIFAQITAYVPFNVEVNSVWRRSENQCT